MSRQTWPLACRYAVPALAVGALLLGSGRRAGWVLVMAMPFLLAAQMPAAAGRIASQLSGELEMESVRGDLVRE